ILSYTGLYWSILVYTPSELSPTPPTEDTVTMTVTYAEYQPHVGDQDALKLTVAGAVQETGQVLAKELLVRLHTPELTLTV
ncbi:TGM1 glutamyltransferase, partial [Sterrhoptilus dennistouni]|nr:TGM1 glutamyltransferase [Sterrhoptilus dennistouni]